MSIVPLVMIIEITWFGWRLPGYYFSRCNYYLVGEILRLCK